MGAGSAFVKVVALVRLSKDIPGPLTGEGQCTGNDGAHEHVI